MDAIMTRPDAADTSDTADALAAVKYRLIEKAIDDLRPRLARDGGDCELVGVEGNTVKLKLTGTCVGCQLAALTMNGIRQKLIEATNLPLRIQPVMSA
ncbi:NifU family protein [Martelella sp. HB161492]|uniref:NifU family protein n=1 Tax=Martelella sp. HB161492 TaxID=2720726 RepID=UPI001FED2D30|nr:NifU family protein [Martelella sp. HB161492]